MHTIRDHSTGIELLHTMTVYDHADGTTEFVTRTRAPGLDAQATVKVSPQELSMLIDALITTYNRYVDSGVVDTTKYPHLFS
ncbi:hypothetical protein GCM10022252_19900 [Streptosporangium oxazolinicum]|uniref:Uncharacterized protein n=1 Tax=Streptosporangium oxazolinicum TaxID=909287 RepID=A0ABP8ANT8_9ACTN